MATMKKTSLILGVIGAAAALASTAEGGEGGRGRPVVLLPAAPAPGLSIDVNIPLPFAPVVVPAYPVYPAYPVLIGPYGREGGEGYR